MNIQALKSTGTFFVCEHPRPIYQIPNVQDVLYVLGVSGEQKYYKFCLSQIQYTLYVANVHLAVAAVSGEVLRLKPSAARQIRTIVAFAIIELTRPEDRCLFDPALNDAMEMITGMQVGSRTRNHGRLRESCGCSDCKKIVRDQQNGASAHTM